MLIQSDREAQAPVTPHPSSPAEKPAGKKVTFDDLSLGQYTRTPRVEKLRQHYFDACPEVCIERPRWVTEYHKKDGLFDKPRISILDKARVYRKVLNKRKAIVWHQKALDQDGNRLSFVANSLFAGSTTSKFKGVVLYPEFLALALWPELRTMDRRQANPYKISPEESKILDQEAFPPWLDKNILEWARREAKKSLSPPNFDLYQQFVFFLATKANTITHTIPHFSRAIQEGLRAIIDDAKAREKRVTSAEQREFYQAIAEVLEGIIEYSHKLADEAEHMARCEPDPVKRRELLTLADIHRHVPEFPARTFREGLTTMWLAWIALHLENSNNALSMGRMDQFLYDLYRADIDSGAMTIEEAIELCCCLRLKIGDHIPTVPEAAEQLFGGTGSNQAITIGGVDAQGNDAVNDLTYIILRAIELMKLRDPNLNARYMPGVNPPEYLRQLCLTNINTGATPALHNDRAVIEAMTNKGDAIEYARDYGVVGCVEPSSCGRQYGHSGAALINLTSVLELALFNGRHRHTGEQELVSLETGEVGTFDSFEDFRAAFDEQLVWMADEVVKMNNALGRTHQLCYPTPIMSAFFEGPMEKGKDVICGGALINSSGVSIIGLADTGDSLSAIQKLVFEDETITFSELIEAIKCNFKGYEALQMALINPEKTPKWGNEDPTADANVEWLLQRLDEVFSSHQNYRGGGYRVGYWTMTNHAGYGKLMQALPNGRKAHENFTSGFTPVSGVTPHLTPTLNSVAAMPARYMSSGVAFNLKFKPEAPGDTGQILDKMVYAVEGYMGGHSDAIGGMEIQFNITNREDFLSAIKNPKEYPDLLVRVSGYTAYFKDLNPQMQKEILERTEYELASGKAIHTEPFRLT